MTDLSYPSPFRSMVMDGWLTCPECDSNELMWYEEHGGAIHGVIECEVCGHHSEL